MMRLPLTAALAVLLTAPAMAQTPPPPLPAGQTILNVSAIERIQVPQDLLVARLRVEKTGPDAMAVQNDINTLMKSSTEKAKAVAGVKLSTGGYYVYEEPSSMPSGSMTAPPQKKIWRGSQSLELKSLAAADLLKLAGELQGMGLMMEGIDYTLSPEKADDVRDSLMEAALAKVRAKAERAAKAMGKTQTELVEINVDSPDMPGPMPMRAMAMSASMEKMATPTAEPGETEITLTVTARALLKP